MSRFTPVLVLSIVLGGCTKLPDQAPTNDTTAKPSVKPTVTRANFWNDVADWVEGGFCGTSDEFFKVCKQAREQLKLPPDERVNEKFAEFTDRNHMFDDEVTARVVQKCRELAK